MTARVLLLQRDARDRQVVLDALTSLGIETEVHSAFSLQAAQRPATAPFDVIVADLRLEDATGPAIVTQLRAAHPEAKLVVVSAPSPGEGEREALLHGAHLFVGKDEARASKARLAAALAVALQDDGPPPTEQEAELALATLRHVAAHVRALLRRRREAQRRTQG